MACGRPQLHGVQQTRSVRAMGAFNRTVVPITVTVRICLANSYSPVGTDASSSIDAIGTSGCAARLREHERSKCDHDGEHRYTIPGKAQPSVFRFGYLLDYRSTKLLRRCSRIKIPAIMGPRLLLTASKAAGIVAAHGLAHEPVPPQHVSWPCDGRRHNLPLRRALRDDRHSAPQLPRQWLL